MFLFNKIRLSYYVIFILAISNLVGLIIYEGLPLESYEIRVLVCLLSAVLTGVLLLKPIFSSLRSIIENVKNFYSDDPSINSKKFICSEFSLVSKYLDQIRENTKQVKAGLTRQDQTRRELLANAAHDIKGPLSAIRGYLEDLQSRIDSNNLEQAKSSLEICLKNTHLLEKIVKEIFESAKFDNLDGNLALEVASIDELLSDITQKFQARASKEFKHLIFKSNAKSALLQLDLGLIERAISNLLDNAFKYTQQEGQITIGSKIEKDCALIYISDSGKGIPEKDLPYIFDKLYRVEKDRSKEAKGSGFGLSIVKKIVEAHAGSIICSSTLGEGSVFQINLPTIKKEKITQAVAEMITKPQ